MVESIIEGKKCFMKIVWIGFIMMTLCSRIVQAEGEPLSLEACLRIGLEQSPVAKQARLQEEIAHTQIGQAGSLALPHFRLHAGYTRLDEVQTIDFGDESLPMGTVDMYEAGAGVSQLLYSGGQVGAAWRAAKLARSYAAANRREVESVLKRDIEVHFYGVLLAKDVVDVQQAAVEQWRAHARQVEERQRSGAASEFDVLTASVRLANEKPALIAARNQYELAKAGFARLLHMPVESLTITGSLERVSLPRSLEEMQTLALSERPEIQASQVRLQLAQEAVVSARSAAKPEVRAFFNYQGANTYQFASLDDEWEWRWNAGVTLNWNFWDGNMTRQTVKQKRLEHQQLQEADEAVREALKLEATQAYLDWVHAHETLEAVGETVTLAERALEIAQSRYETGLSTYLEVTDANLALRSARLARLRARHDVAVAAARADFVCGQN